MATIFEKFPGFVNTVAMADQGIRPEPVMVTFTANLLAGAFTFNNRVQAFGQNGQEMVVLDGIKIAGDIDENVFSQNLLTPFSLQAYRRTNQSTVSAKWVFGSYQQGEGFTSVWLPASTEQGKEDIQFHLAGSINQGIELAARASVSIFVSANVYLVKQQLFEEFLNIRM